MNKRRGVFDEQTKTVFMRLAIFILVVWAVFFFFFREEKVETNDRNNKTLDEFIEDLNNPNLFEEINLQQEISKDNQDEEIEKEVEN